MSQSLIMPHVIGGPERPRLRLDIARMKEIEYRGQPIQHELPAPPELDKVVRMHEKSWRGEIPGGRARCVVGVTCDDEDAFIGTTGGVSAYVRGVVASGGTPRLICPSRGDIGEQFRQVDALLIPGGQDIEPIFYGQERHPGMAKSWTYPEMDAFEIACIQHAYESKTPMLGICRGEQLMNVAAKGTLIQDIPSEHTPKALIPVNHQPRLPGGSTSYMPSHLIQISPTSRLHEILRTDSIAVNSTHHQAIGEVSPLLKVTAVAMDNTVEAVERIGVPTQMGVQCHPEQARLIDRRFQRLFDNLVKDGAAFHKQRFEIAAQTSAHEIA